MPYPLELVCLLLFLGLQKAGLIVANPATFVSLGEFTPSTLLAVGGIVIGGVLVARKVKGALFYAIVAVTLLSIPLGITRIPEGFSLVSMPHSLEPVFFKLDFHSLLSPNMLIAIFSLVFMDIFDTLGTLVGTANKVGMVKPEVETCDDGGCCGNNGWGFTRNVNHHDLR